MEELDVPGLQEMLVIGVVALLVFGPDRLPEVARNVGRFVAKLRFETQRNMNELKDISEIRELQRELQTLRADLQGVTNEFTGPLRDLPGSAPRGSSPRGSSPRGSSRGSSVRAQPTGHDDGPSGSDGGVMEVPVDGPPPPTDPDAT